MGNIPIVLLATAVVGWATSSFAKSSRPQLKPQAQTLLVVWDFDWTIVNCNSDEYIPAQFMSNEILKNRFRELYKSTKGDWHACVETVINESGASPRQSLEAAQRMPFLTGVRAAIEKMHHSGAEQMILSDGNTLFIGAFLEEQKLTKPFNQGVISNTGSWTINAKLKVTHQSVKYGGHNCDRCSANLCKSQALSREALANRPRPNRIVYVGDGGNDACPVLNVLQENDIMLARVGKRRACANERKGAETDEEACKDTTFSSEFGIVPALEKAKAQDPPLVPKCQVWKWSTGEELRLLVERILQEP